MAQRGYLGIHAEVPTAQCLRSASVVNGALKIKSQSRQSRQSQSTVINWSTAIASKLCSHSPAWG
ncbi:hypothetical protein [Pseudomonas sp. P97.38]|uniref:hypothetical protein n=1 Tax=Pseudomonas sp. P97.38 TaxID=255451 RepID=UPI0009F81F5B|nr:hypothetical protein [Pseudomonas sp. P97.38]